MLSKSEAQVLVPHEKRRRRLAEIVKHRHNPSTARAGAVKASMGYQSHCQNTQRSIFRSPFLEKILLNLVVVAHVFNLQHLGGRDRQISAFEVSIIYRVSSRTVRVT